MNTYNRHVPTNHVHYAVGVVNYSDRSCGSPAFIYLYRSALLTALNLISVSVLQAVTAVLVERILRMRTWYAQKPSAGPSHRGEGQLGHLPRAPA